MDTNKLTQMIRIAKMHYEQNYTQLEIASKEGISKATVSGFSSRPWTWALSKYALRIPSSMTRSWKRSSSPPTHQTAVIVPDLVGNEQILLQDVCAALINDLPRYIKNDSILGVFYGHT